LKNWGPQFEKMGQRKIGLHVRLTSTLTDVVQKALRLELPFFQCFLLLQSTGNLIQLDDADVQSYVELRRKHFNDIYLHGSYWINLAGVRFTKHYSLDRELALAKKLEFTHIVLHPGSAKGAKTRQEGIDAMAHVINKILRKEHTIKIVIENGAYGALSVGGDLTDFQLLLSKLEQPEKILFCIDTAHAHSFGYDIIDAASRESFIQLLDETIGIESIALLHLNDTNEKRGSQNDRHEVVGKGVLGDQVLRDFALHPRLKHIPLLLELPVLTEIEEKAVLDKVKSWHTQQGEE